MVKPFDLIREAKEILVNSDTPQLDAEVILSHVMNQDRMYLFMNRDAKVPQYQQQLYWELIKRRRLGEPVAYIIGVKEFMGLDFYVEPGVLIPRGDTEILVETIIARTNASAYNGETQKIGFSDKLIIVDIGCGSGAIAVSLAKLISDSMVYAVDLMDKPIEMTIKNAEKNMVSENLTAVKSDLFENIDKALLGNIDVIVSNPPYIDKSEYEQLMRDVRDFEPENALTDYGDGLEFYRKISKEAPAWLRKNGLLAFEIGCSQRKEVTELMMENGFANIECICDLSGRDRVILGNLKR